MFYEIYLLDAPYHIDRAFDYESDRDIPVGSIVKVPFGKADRLRLGIVAKKKQECSMGGTKPVHSVFSDRYSLNEEMLGLCLFLKDYTLSTFGEAVRAVLPPGALSETPNIKYNKICSLALSQKELSELLSRTGRAGIKSAGQRAILNYLAEIGEADAELIRRLPGVTSAQLSALREKGIVKVSENEAVRNPYAKYSENPRRDEIVLTTSQRAAYEKLEELLYEDSARAALLFGVTGSGKTKVIMRAIDETLSMGKNVIMMVPEISLTPQTVGIFCGRYGERVAVVHSSLSHGERLDAYRRIKAGEVDLVIGTRSAVFAPLDDIGLIVIDEEHEHTYKSESDPKYHARDVAAYRAGKHKALMLLASATPSLESFYKAKTGKYTLITLKERYGGVKLPCAIIVDMREELRLGNVTGISERLLTSLEAVKEKGEQAILFLNRRGYNSQINCKVCGEVISCPRCSVSLTYHARGGGKMLCHFCGHTEPVPKKCPSCSSEELSFVGVGTQKIESELETYIPSSSVMRMDADTTSGKLSYDRMLEDFRCGRADILLGTQMVAKGHDFPKVTLVGVVLADTSLYVSDFRAAERTFSLLTQVIGRAGRARDGVAVIQTYSPKNEIIRLACLQDYEKFYEGEIAIREELSYPPFCDMVTLTLTSEDERALFEATKKLSESVKEKLSGTYSKYPFVAFGPHEADVYKLNDKYRMKMVLKCKLNSETRKLFHELLLEFSLERGVNLSVQLNPISI
ncbi:MAG: primosomal protein N' [Clostridia bacterium]|nr:primosomal protein N' [Clostridia bacterium]